MDAEFSARNAQKVISKGLVTERRSSISSATPALKKPQKKLNASISLEDATISIKGGLVSNRTRRLKEAKEEVNARHARHRQDEGLNILAGDLTRKGSVKGSAEMFKKVAEGLKEKTPRPLGAKKSSGVKDVPRPQLEIPILKELEATTEGADEANGAEGGEKEGGDAGEAGMVDNRDAEHKNGKDLEEVGMDMKASPDATGGGTSTNSPDLSISPLPVDGADDKDKTSGEEAKTEANSANASADIPILTMVSPEEAEAAESSEAAARAEATEASTAPTALTKREAAAVAESSEAAARAEATEASTAPAVLTKREAAAVAERELAAAAAESEEILHRSLLGGSWNWPSRTRQWKTEV